MSAHLVHSVSSSVFRMSLSCRHGSSAWTEPSVQCTARGSVTTHSNNCTVGICSSALACVALFEKVATVNLTMHLECKQKLHDPMKFDKSGSGGMMQGANCSVAPEWPIEGQ